MLNKTNLGLVAVIVVLAVIYFNDDHTQDQLISENTTQHRTLESSLFAGKDDTAQIAAAFQQQKGDVQVQATGTVKMILKDDNDGSRHQRFILELSNGQTVLVAHNIDLAPRVENLAKGDRVEFYGEYEYNPQGGVIHWTHHDPRGNHPYGWLKHQGKTYQ